VGTGRENGDWPTSWSWLLESPRRRGPSALQGNNFVNFCTGRRPIAGHALTDPKAFMKEPPEQKRTQKITPKRLKKNEKTN
jgi:hypothetical protein